jgi:hypothetical protein
MDVDQRFTLDFSAADYRCVTCGAAVHSSGRAIHHLWHRAWERHLEIDPEEPAETGGVVQ